MEKAGSVEFISKARVDERVKEADRMHRDLPAIVANIRRGVSDKKEYPVYFWGDDWKHRRFRRWCYLVAEDYSKLA